MKVFVTLIKKEFWHVWRDKRSLFILLGMPIIMMLIFGFALTNEVKNSEIAVLDLSKDNSSKKLIEKIDQSQYFSLTRYLSHDSQIDGIFRKGLARIVLIIPTNFDNDVSHQNAAQLRLIADASDPNTANITIKYASAIIRDFLTEIQGQQKLPYAINVETRMLYNPQLKSSYNFVPGVMTLIMMLLGAMMTSVSIVKEKENGTMEILLVSPMKPFLVIFSKAIPYLVLCFVDIILILLMAVFVLDMTIKGSIFLLLSTSILFIITTLSLGLLISTITTSQRVAMFISLVALMLPSLIFSGFMFPIENMPLPLQFISNLIPTKWYYSIVRSVMIKGLGISYIIKPILILVAMTTFYLLVAIKKFKVRLA